MSSAWHFGGKDIEWEGFGHGTIDGNGQAWYDWVDGVNNYPGRPHGITIFAENSIIRGLRFVQSQMWYVSASYVVLWVPFIPERNGLTNTS